MLELMRTVRFCLEADGSIAAQDPDRGDNTFAWWPAMRGLGRYYELEVRCRGEADPVTGYFVNIKRIDRVVREKALPRVAAAASDPRKAGRLGDLLRELVGVLGAEFPGAGVSLRLAPTYALEMEARDMDHVFVTQQYEFSAAHRLHVPNLSEAENRELFGKCNNPAGHGHNYRLQVTVRSAIDPEGRTLDVAKLDAAVDAAVIRKFDHKNLTTDVAEFRTLNTTVENIAKVTWDLLRDAVSGAGTELSEVKVWETGKTVCAYRGV